MSHIRLVTPFMSNYTPAFPIPIHAHGLEFWLRITTDESSPTSTTVNQAFNELLTDTPTVIPIESALGAPSDANHMGLYVLSTTSGHLGASIILHPLAIPALQNTLHAKNITLIPSSVHELLAIPEGMLGDHELRDLTTMIQSINASEVAPEDQLDDQPWILHDGIISRCCHQTQKISAPAPAYAVAKS